jgi:hypothetical protein
MNSAMRAPAWELGPILFAYFFYPVLPMDRDKCVLKFKEYIFFFSVGFLFIMGPSTGAACGCGPVLSFFFTQTFLHIAHLSVCSRKDISCGYRGKLCPRALLESLFVNP